MVETLRRVRKLVDEKERRNKETRLNRFKPTAKQQEVLNSDAQILGFVGPNQTGKTHLGVAWILAAALGKQPWNNKLTVEPPTANLIIGTDFVNHIAGVVIPKIYELLPESSVSGVERMQNGTISVIRFKNGSFIKMGSNEQEVEKFEGATHHRVWIDEPIRENVWHAVRRGLIAKKGRALFTMTPLSQPWIFEDLYQKSGTDPNIFFATASKGDNPYLDPAEVEKWEASLPEEEREARIYGRFKHLIGRVYKSYDPGIHRIEPEKYPIDKNWPIIHSADFHDRKPWFLLWAAITPRNDLVVIHEWPNEKFQDCQTSLSLVEYVNLIREIESQFPGGQSQVAYRVGDPNSGRTPSVVSGNRLYEDLAIHDLFYDVDINDSLQDGHAAVRQRLYYDRKKPVADNNKPSLYVYNHCRNIHEGFNCYVYDNWRGKVERAAKEKPLEVGKDPMDALRYMVMLNMGYFSLTEHQDVVGLQEDRIRRSQVFLL
jgi:hypothetical protein